MLLENRPTYKVTQLCAKSNSPWLITQQLIVATEIPSDKKETRVFFQNHPSTFQFIVLEPVLTFFIAGLDILYMAKIHVSPNRFYLN